MDSRVDNDVFFHVGALFLTATEVGIMKMRAVSLSLIFMMFWWFSSPLWAAGDKSAESIHQYQNMTEELMGMLKETMGILRNLDRAPTAEEKRQLDEMMGRMDVMLRQQRNMMKDMQDQLDNIRKQQEDFLEQQRLLQLHKDSN